MHIRLLIRDLKGRWTRNGKSFLSFGKLFFFFFVPVRPSSSTWRPSFNTSSRYFSSSSKKLLLSFCCLHSVSYLMLGRAMSPRNPPEMEQRKRKNKKSKEKRARKLHLGEKLKLLTLSTRRDNLCRNIVRETKKDPRVIQSS